MVSHKVHKICFVNLSKCFLRIRFLVISVFLISRYSTVPNPQRFSNAKYQEIFFIGSFFESLSLLHFCFCFSVQTVRLGFQHFYHSDFLHELNEPKNPGPGWTLRAEFTNSLCFCPNFHDLIRQGCHHYLSRDAFFVFAFNHQNVSLLEFLQ